MQVPDQGLPESNQYAMIRNQWKRWQTDGVDIKAKAGAMNINIAISGALLKTHLR